MRSDWHSVFVGVSDAHLGYEVMGLLANLTATFDKWCKHLQMSNVQRIQSVWLRVIL